LTQEAVQSLSLGTRYQLYRCRSTTY